MLVPHSDLVEGPQPLIEGPQPMEEFCNQTWHACSLQKRLKKEQEDKEDKRRYKAQPHLYTIIKVARDEDLREQIGKDIYFDLVDHDKVCNFRIQKQMPFHLFKDEVAKELGIPVQFQRFWIWAERENHTYRPNRPLNPQEEAQTVGALREVSNKAHNAELKLYLEVERGPDLHPVPPPEKIKEDILLFFKLYDPEKEELRYVGRLFVKSSGKPIEILTKLNELAGFAPDEEIELFEEIKYEPSVMCECLDKSVSFRFSQIEDGDIICFQKRPPPENEEKIRFPDVPLFLEYVKNRQVVHFRALERPKEDEFFLELAKNHTYDDVVERVAHRLGLDDPSKIQLTPHNCYSQQPKPNPIKYKSVDHLLDMLVHYNQISDILYYEVLDIPLPELRCLKTLKVAFHHATKNEALILNIRLPKQSTVGDVLNEIKTKVGLSHPSAELRLLEVFYHKIYKIFPVNEKIENINDQYRTLRAEEIPEEEKNLGPNDRLIHVYHFTKESAQNQVQVQNFGEPFFLVIHDGETLKDVKVRIQKRLQVPDEEFSKWKFAFLSLGRPEYLEDSNIVSSHFQRRDVYGAWEQYLGLEHSDMTPKRADAASQHDSLLVEAKLSRAPVSLESYFGTTMTRLSVAERAKQRISSKCPKPAQSKPAASKPVEPPSKRTRLPSNSSGMTMARLSVAERAKQRISSKRPKLAQSKPTALKPVEPSSKRTRRPSNSFGEQTVSSPIEEVATDPAPPTQAPTTLANAPSFFHSAARGLALSIGDSLVRDVDREVLKDASTKVLAEASCLASLQVMTIQNVWAQKCRVAIGNWRAAQRQLEEEKATHAVKVAEMDSRAAKMGSQVVELEGALAESRTKVVKARADAVQEFKYSPAYVEALKQAVEAYKKSDECLDWADERSVDYLEVGFARCRLQLQERGLLPHGTNLDFLDYSKEMLGEPPIGGVAGEWEQ